MAKKHLISIIVLILIVAGAIGGFLYFRSQPSDEAMKAVEDLLADAAPEDYYETATKLVVEKGLAIVTKANGDEWRVEDAAEVAEGDTIVVAPESRASIHWFDDSISRLQAGTELTIEKAAWNPENLTETDINFQVIKGEVWSKVRQLVDEESEFLSYSGNIVAGVRGSVYNLVVGENGVEVDSVEHAALVAEINPETRELLEPRILTKGKLMRIHTEEKNEEGNMIMTMEDIPEERAERPWFKDNQTADEKAREILQMKNIERLRRQVGALPGEEGYETKVKLIGERIKRAKTPEERTRLETAAAKLKAGEAVAMMMTKKADANPGKVMEGIDSAEQMIQKSNLPQAEKDRLSRQLHTEIKALDRTMEDVLPDESRLYEVRESLREKEVKMMEAEPKKQEKMIQKTTERKLFELEDAVSRGKLDKKAMKEELKRYQEQIKGLQGNMSEWGNFRQLTADFTKRMEKEGFDKEDLENWQKFLDSDDFNALMNRMKDQLENLPSPEELMEKEKEIRAEEPVKIEPAPIQKTPPPPEPKPVVREQAPYYQGESDHRLPAEDPVTIRREAPYYGGESNR